MTSTKPKRRWYRFSLKTLLIVMTLFTVAVGWVGSRMNRARVNRERVARVNGKLDEREWQAAAMIREIGGNVRTELLYSRRPTILEWLFNDPGGPDDPTAVDTVRSVEIGSPRYFPPGTKVTKAAYAGLEHLKNLGNLEYLNLYGTAVTDAGLEHLKGLKNLKKLYVWQTQVTDEGIAKLKEALPEVTVVK